MGTLEILILLLLVGAFAAGMWAAFKGQTLLGTAIILICLLLALTTFGK